MSCQKNAKQITICSLKNGLSQLVSSSAFYAGVTSAVLGAAIAYQSQRVLKTQNIQMQRAAEGFRQAAAIAKDAFDWTANTVDETQLNQAKQQLRNAAKLLPHLSLKHSSPLLDYAGKIGGAIDMAEQAAVAENAFIKKLLLAKAWQSAVEGSQVPYLTFSSDQSSPAWKAALIAGGKVGILTAGTVLLVRNLLRRRRKKGALPPPEKEDTDSSAIPLSSQKSRSNGGDISPEAGPPTLPVSGK